RPARAALSERKERRPGRLQRPHPPAAGAPWSPTLAPRRPTGLAGGPAPIGAGPPVAFRSLEVERRRRWSSGRRGRAPPPGARGRPPRVRPIPRQTGRPERPRPPRYTLE